MGKVRTQGKGKGSCREMAQAEGERAEEEGIQVGAKPGQWGMKVVQCSQPQVECPGKGENVAAGGGGSALNQAGVVW